MRRPRRSPVDVGELAVAPGADERLAVALRPRQPRRREADGRRARRRRPPGDRRQRLAPLAGVADDPARATRPRPSSNCGFTIASSSPSRARQRDDRPAAPSLSEMNETSIVARSAAKGSWAGSRSRALTRSSTVTRGSLRSPQSSWPVGDVDRDHARRAALEQAVGEATGRGADVEAARPLGRRARRLERGGELHPAARRRTAAARRPDQLGVVSDQLARLARQRPVAADPHPARAHRLGGAGPRAARAHARRAGCRSAAGSCGEGTAPGPRLAAARRRPQPPSPSPGAAQARSLPTCCSSPSAT